MAIKIYICDLKNTFHFYFFITRNKFTKLKLKYRCHNKFVMFETY